MSSSSSFPSSFPSSLSKYTNTRSISLLLLFLLEQISVWDRRLFSSIRTFLPMNMYVCTSVYKKGETCMPRDKYATEIERARSRALCVRVSKTTWIELSHKIDDELFLVFSSSEKSRWTLRERTSLCVAWENSLEKPFSADA